MTFGVVYPHSTQLFILRDWLMKAGLVPERDYRIVVVPPPQMATHLRAGHLDGFCVGEPWASVAVRSGAGVIAALSADLAPGHAEKVLLVRGAFVEERRAEHNALVRALVEACAWCADPNHREEVVSLLAGRHGLGVPIESIRPSVMGDIDMGAGRHRTGCDAMIFHGDGINEPSLSRVEWLARQVDPTVSLDILRSVYRTDLFHEATESSTAFARSHVPDAILTRAA
jgi:ABC-type nitrate/sulfonate/bicarbonate transport system substrate-binding protein